jgi:hypothetical protein
MGLRAGGAQSGDRQAGGACGGQPEGELIDRRGRDIVRPDVELETGRLARAVELGHGIELRRGGDAINFGAELVHLILNAEAVGVAESVDITPRNFRSGTMQHIPFVNLAKLALSH